MNMNNVNLSAKQPQDTIQKDERHDDEIYTYEYTEYAEYT